MSLNTDDTNHEQHVPLLQEGQQFGYRPSAPRAPQDQKMEDTPNETRTSLTIGQMPYSAPNISQENEAADLDTYINGTTRPNNNNGCIACSTIFFCGITGIGCCYLCSKQQLISQGQYGFAMNNGTPEMLFPGRHFLVSPLNSLSAVVSQGDDVIQNGPITIVRIARGQLGFAESNGKQEILLPGRHARNSAAFKFRFTRDINDQLIEFGPIKIVTVKTGEVQICYDSGSVVIWPEGRYAVNSPTFRVAGRLTTQQQNVRFEKHSVLLDGGINMLVEGLLTYKVVDVEKLVREIGEGQLLRAIKDITKAELSRVFAGVHLEQLAVAQKSVEADEKSSALLGQQDEATPGETNRNQICNEVIDYITPVAARWGVEVMNFQLESTKIADVKYAHEYEEASLALAKAKANRRAVEATNEILLQNATATASAQRIKAEGSAQARVIEAEGEAKARTIEAESRNTAAEAMTNPFSKQFALQGLQVDFAKNLKAQVLTVGGDSTVGQNFQMKPGDLGLQLNQ